MKVRLSRVWQNLPEEDIALVTLLGSCAGNGPASESARYGSYAMEKLVNEGSVQLFLS